MDRGLKTKIKLFGLLGGIIAWRTWNLINYVIEYPESFTIDILTIGIFTTILILLTTIIMITKRNQFARITIQLIFIFFILTKILTYFTTPSDIYTTTDYIRHGLILIIYGYIIYFLQSKDMKDFMDTRQQQTVEN